MVKQLWDGPRKTGYATVTRYDEGYWKGDLNGLAVTDTMVICGAWTFDIMTGAEIDEDLGWGPPPLYTGSFLQRDKL